MINTNTVRRNELLSVPLEITAATTWFQVGPEIEAWFVKSLFLYVSIDINQAQDFRIRALGGDTKGNAVHSLPIKAVSASVVKVEPEYLEFNVDADQKMILQIELDSGIPYVQIEASIGTDGGANPFLNYCNVISVL